MHFQHMFLLLYFLLYSKSPAASKITVGSFRIIMGQYMAYEILTSSNHSSEQTRATSARSPEIILKLAR